MAKRKRGYYAKDNNEKNLSVFDKLKNMMKPKYKFTDLTTAYRDMSNAQKEGDEELADEIYTILLRKIP